MNYALNISCIVEDKLAQIQRPSDWTQADEAQAYDRCLRETVEENGRAWADGNIRVGDYILLSKCSFLDCGVMKSVLFNVTHVTSKLWCHTAAC